MNVLCFDIASGGLSACLFDEQLKGTGSSEVRWQIVDVLEVAAFDRAFSTVLRSFGDSRFDAICFSAFMHSCVLIDPAGEPLTPIFTWMDRRGEEGVDYLRNEIGPEFHKRTGCRFHPMFPVFKLASLMLQKDPALASAARIVSARSLAVARLTGQWAEDHGTASATGLYDIQKADWDADLARLLRLNPGVLPALVDRTAVAGAVTAAAASRYGIAAGTPVIAGSGDGFMASVGSGCNEPSRIAVTLGTSAAVRQVVTAPVLDENAGTFCYRMDGGHFLLGCAGSNGGNVLDWARLLFGAMPEVRPRDHGLPTFLPLLNGERSPEWDSTLSASWHGVTASTTTEDSAWAALEGVVFNLAHYVQIVQRASGLRASQIILSGNGFLEPANAGILAAILDSRVLLPRDQGLASLRGAAVCGFQALGLDSSRAMETLLQTADHIPGEPDPGTRERFERYRELRERVRPVLTFRP